MTTSNIRHAALCCLILACAALPALGADHGALPSDAHIIWEVCHYDCRLAEKKLLSDDAAGNGRLLVIGKEKEKKDGEQASAAASAGAEEGADESSEAGEPPCPTPVEDYAVLHYSNGEILSSEEVLHMPSNGCSYGVGGGEEYSSFDGAMVKLHITGGSSWRWEGETIWALEPEVHVFYDQSVGYKGETYYSTTTVNEAGVSKTVWSAPLCDDSETDPSYLEPGPEYRYTSIPKLSTSSAFAVSWSSAPFPDNCVTVSAGEYGDGYLIYGKYGSRTDSRMKVVRVSNKEFLVEVADDAFIFGDPNWLNEDHLEVWEGSKLPSYMGCLEKRKASQWGIRLSDGKVFPARGAPKENPAVELAELPASGGMNVKRLKLTFPAPAESVSFVYSDTDDGKKVERLTGTSKVMLKDSNSLGK
jgi:hypothetical protein